MFFNRRSAQRDPSLNYNYEEETQSLAESIHTVGPALQTLGHRCVSVGCRAGTEPLHRVTRFSGCHFYIGITLIARLSVLIWPLRSDTTRNIWCSPNADPMLGHRRRRWPNIGSAVGECIMCVEWLRRGGRGYIMYGILPNHHRHSLVI